MKFILMPLTMRDIKTFDKSLFVTNDHSPNLEDSDIIRDMFKLRKLIFILVLEILNC